MPNFILKFIEREEEWARLSARPNPRQTKDGESDVCTRLTHASSGRGKWRHKQSPLLAITLTYSSVDGMEN